MFRNQYDNDVTTWSPQGRLHQVEYAMEAVKQGSCTVGIKSKDSVVLLCLKRSANELSTHQRKLLKIDDHICVAIAGLTSDARVLSKFMRTECLHSKFSFDTPLPVSRLVSTLGDKAQVTTQRYGRRPYGVGMLIAGVDASGPRLFQFCPSSNFFDCKAMSIGARSQSARTYLERNLEGFADAPVEELIKHGCKALRDSLTNNAELTIHNTSCVVISKAKGCVFLSDTEIQEYLTAIDDGTGRKTTTTSTEESLSSSTDANTDIAMNVDETEGVTSTDQLME